jgi:hypothetical protein
VSSTGGFAATPNAFSDGANAQYSIRGHKDMVFDHIKLHDGFRVSTSNRKDSQTELGIGLRISTL